MDRCVECGYCEPVCPSRDLTLTPRQRIVLRREMERGQKVTTHWSRSCEAVRLRRRGHLRRGRHVRHRLSGPDQHRRSGATAAPGARSRQRRRGWALAAKHWGATSRAAGAALTVAGALPGGAAGKPRRCAGSPTRTGAALVARPAVAGGAPRPVRDRRALTRCCQLVHRRCSAAGDGSGAEAFALLCRRAGVRLSVPDDLPSLCCGTPWKSKGLRDGAAAMAARVLPALWEATRLGGCRW